MSGRPFPAESLIKEAYAIFSERGDEIGIAAVDRVFAAFLASRVLSIQYYAEHYRKRGFWDKATRYDDRYPRAIEYYNRALAIYQRHGRTDWMTYVYIGIAETHLAFGNSSEACTALTNSEREYGSTTSFGKDINVVPDFSKVLEDLRARAQCA